MTTEKMRKDLLTFVIIMRGKHYLTERRIVSQKMRRSEKRSSITVLFL